MLTWIIGKLRELKSWVQGELSALKRSVDSAIAILQRALNSAILGVKNWVQDQLTKLEKWWNGTIVPLYNRIAQGVREAIDKAKAAAQALIAGVVTFIKALIANVAAGLVTLRNWVNGLWNTFKNWVATQLGNLLRQALKLVTELWNKIVGWVKLFFSALLAPILAMLLPLWEALWPLIHNIIFFFAQPWKFLMALFEVYLWPWVGYQVAIGLAGPRTKIGAPPDPGDGGQYNPDPGGTGPPPGAGKLSPPLSSIYVSGFRFAPNHPGVDLGAAMGAPVFAAHDGTISDVGFDPDGFGNVLQLSGSPWWTRYAHLQSINVARRQEVRARQQIATADSTGDSSGPHLHFEVKYNGKYVDPLSAL